MRLLSGAYVFPGDKTCEIILPANSQKVAKAN
jgi:hypothetical protein